MQKRYALTQTQQAVLRENTNVRSVSACMVQYTAEFKRHVLEARARGERPRDIFIKAGIPLEWFGEDHVRSRIREWTRRAAKHGLEYFDAEHRGSNGVAVVAYREKKRRYLEMTDKEKVTFLEAENEALEYVRRRFNLPPSIRYQ
jgi:hypothetical protein